MANRDLLQDSKPNILVQLVLYVFHPVDGYGDRLVNGNWLGLGVNVQLEGWGGPYQGEWLVAALVECRACVLFSDPIFQLLPVNF